MKIRTLSAFPKYKFEGSNMVIDFGLTPFTVELSDELTREEMVSCGVAALKQVLSGAADDVKAEHLREMEF